MDPLHLSQLSLQKAHREQFLPRDGAFAQTGLNVVRQSRRLKRTVGGFPDAPPPPAKRVIIGAADQHPHREIAATAWKFTSRRSHVARLPT